MVVFPYGFPWFSILWFCMYDVMVGTSGLGILQKGDRRSTSLICAPNWGVSPDDADMAKPLDENDGGVDSLDVGGKNVPLDLDGKVV